MSKRLSPAVATTVDSIREAIGQGHYARGSFLPTENTLANELKVSRGTVRQAIDVLAGTGEITKRLHSRPMVGMSKGHGRVSQATDIHVWVSHPIADEATLAFMKGISRALKGTPYQLTVREPTRFFGDYVKSDEREFLSEMLNDDQVAGAIIQRDPSADNGDILAKVLNAGKPLVFVDCDPPASIHADHVGTANLASARRCVEHLIDLGHRRIFCLVDLEGPRPTQERMRGYWRAMKQAGLEEMGGCLSVNTVETGSIENLKIGGPYVAKITKSSIYTEWAHRLASKLLTMENRPTALFVTCDVLAYCVCAFLEGAGLRIPEDISVVGFDWLARWDGPDADLLTTASQDFEGFGRHSVDLLLDRITGEYLSAPRQVLLDAPLVMRSSTAPELSTLRSNLSMDRPHINAR